MDGWEGFPSPERLEEMAAQLQALADRQIEARLRPPKLRRHAPPYLCRHGEGWGRPVCGRPLTARKHCAVHDRPLRYWTEDGIAMVIIRHVTGTLCGYLRIPDDHVWWGLDYNDPAPIVEPAIDSDTLVGEAVDGFGVMPLFVAMFSEGGLENLQRTIAGNVPVHGGVTYAGPLDFLMVPPGGWWIGFDCSHAGDFAPAEYRDGSDDRLMALYGEDAHVWTVEEVELELRRAAVAVRQGWVGRDR